MQHFLNELMFNRRIRTVWIVLTLFYIFPVALMSMESKIRTVSLSCVQPLCRLYLVHSPYLVKKVIILDKKFGQ